MHTSGPAPLDESDQPVLICDADGRVAACSTAAARMLGRQPTDVLGRPLWSLLGADVAAHAGATKSALLSFGDWAVWVVFLRASGEGPDTGAPASISAQSCGMLFDASRDGIAFTSLDGRILDANPAFQQMLGYSLEELRQLRYQDFTPPRWADMEAAIVRDQILVRGYADDYEKEYIHRDGTVFAVQIRAWLVRDAEGRPQCMAGFARDISGERRAERERRQLESELLHARRMEAIGQLAGGVAHDFNNILTAILGAAELLRAHFDPRRAEDASRLVYLDQIEAAGQRAASLTRQMLSFSRRQARERELLDLNVLIAELEPLLRRIIPENIAIELALSHEPVRIVADPSQIEQSVLNLCVNARDAMPDGGRITIATTHVVLDETYALAHSGARPGPHAVLTVRDTGCGMSREVLDHIFEPFFTTKPAGHGTGLGLATVFGIVNALDGHIRASSEVGRGSTFEILIPMASPGPPRTAAAVPADDMALTGTETVLVCEDDDTVRDVCSRFLRNAGYNVMTASSAEEALRMVGRSVGRIDLLVTDVVMPGMSGHKLAQTLAASHPELKSVFISGYPGADSPGSERLDVLEKPFGRRVLLKRVRAALDAGKSP